MSQSVIEEPCNFEPASQVELRCLADWLEQRHLEHCEPPGNEEPDWQDLCTDEDEELSGSSDW